MALLFAEILRSKSFIFLIGRDETPIMVHSAAISKLSEPLNRLINGFMREAEENCARFLELELEDFERICEFAYRGDYSTPDPIDFADSGECGEVNELYETGESESDESTDEETTKLRTGLGRLTWRFKRRQYVTNELPRELIAEECKPISNTSSTQDFCPVFLAYARIYAFAEQYMVLGLKELTLHKLHRTLRSFTLFDSSRSAVVELARFAYDNDYIPDRGTCGQIDELRELIVEFMGMHLRDMKNFENHRKFLNEEGEYAGDLMDVLQKWRL